MAHHFPQGPHVAVVPVDPVRQTAVIVGQIVDLRSCNLEAEIFPTVGGRAAVFVLPRHVEIVVGNVESTDQGAGIVGDNHFLVIADKIAGGKMGAEDLEFAARLDQRIEKLARRTIGPEAVDHHFDFQAATTGGNQNVEDLPAGAVVLEHVEEQLQAFFRPFQHVHQRRETHRRLADKPQPVFSDIKPLRWFGV